MKTGWYVLIIVLISILAGFLLRMTFEKPKTVSTPVQIQVIDTAKQKSFERKIALKDHIIDSLHNALLKKVAFPKIVFVTAEDSAKSKNLDSTGLANCTQNFIRSLAIISKQDSLNNMLQKRQKRLAYDLDTCANRLSQAIAQKNKADEQFNKQDKKLKRWQGFGLGAGAITIISILLKMLL